MPARKKTLADFVRDGTFLARRHAHLLDVEPLVADPVLRTIQKAHRQEASDFERQNLALEFEKAVRQRLGSRVSLAQRAYAQMGPGGPQLVRYLDDGSTTVEPIDPLDAAWQEWDREYGLAWRLRNDCMHFGDESELARRAGLTTDDLRTIEARLPDLIAGADPELRGEVPDPPGMDLL